MPKWIRFEETTPNLQTKVWNVIANDGDIDLGKVKWFARWRGYAFFPEQETVFEKSCLRDIADFCETENKAKQQE